MKEIFRWVFTLGILPLIDRIAANRRAKREQQARLLREKQEAEKKK